MNIRVFVNDEDFPPDGKKMLTTGWVPFEFIGNIALTASVLNPDFLRLELFGNGIPAYIIKKGQSLTIEVQE